MVYLPQKIITVNNNSLSESTDLSQTLLSFLHGEHYLTVVNNEAITCLSLTQILMNETGLTLNGAVGTALTSRLTDAFVARYADTTVPVALASGLYPNRLVAFNPLVFGDHKVYFTSVNTPDIRDDVTRKGFLDDLAITSDRDMSNYLVAINGVFHRTVLTDNVLYVMDGFRTIRVSGRKDILVVDTSDVGGHTIVPLTTGNITKPDYKKMAVITTASSIQNKTVFAVMDGYFCHTDQKALTVLDATHLGLFTNKLPLIQQFRHNPRTVYRVDRYGDGTTQHSRKYVDPYDSVFLNNPTVPTSQLATADFQYSRLTNYHSFLIVMNKGHLYQVQTDVLSTKTPKMYSYPGKEHLSGMMQYGCGLSPSFLIWKDAFDRKIIYVSGQDNDVDRQDESINSVLIPTLVDEPIAASNLPARFIDYVCA